MRNILRYIVCACLALALGGCIKDEIVGNNFCREGLLSLNIGINETRAAGDNDNGNADLTHDKLPLNENRIDDYEVFLFASGATGEAKFSTYVSGVNATDYTTNNAISVPAGALAELFGSGDTCNIYVVANLGKSLATELKNASTPLTLANLKAYIVSANFATPEVIEGWDLSEYKSAPIQPNFVMDSSGTDTVTKSGNNLTGEVYITRAASKISFMAYIGESMTIDGKVWIPDLENIKVAFNNVVEKGAIDNGSDTEDTFTMPQVEGLYKDLSGVQLITDSNVYTQTPEFEGVVQGVSSWQKVDILVPFYTYSSIWNATENKVDPSIVLTVPWFVKDNKSTTLTNYNYTIPLTAANGDLKLVRNKHYRIALRVGVLGDLDQLASSEFSYEVLDWVGNDINVDLSDPKYLVVDKTFVEMDNVEEILIPYHSSDDCVITDLTVKRDNLYAGTEASQDDKNSTHSAELVTVDGKTYIKVYNDLDNNLFANNSFNSNFDIEKYTITLTISHKNADGSANSTYTENIKILQYPALFGVAQLNSNAERTNNNDKNGFVYVNGYRGTWSSSTGVTNFDNCGGLSNGSVTAQSMFVFTVSSVQGTDYIIGDPRKREVDNLDKYNFDLATGYSTYTGQNREGLEFYYPTDAVLGSGESSPTYKMVAPKFRLSSGYGQISTNGARRYYKNAVGRCATYQEDGYPAGRWRLPTAAEFKLLNTLVANQVIPTVYQIGLDYWCAHGFGSYEDGDVEISSSEDYGSNSVSIRCVYDDWYWGSEPVNDNGNNPNGDRFTWGDEPR